MTQILMKRPWNGWMGEESVEATVYSFALFEVQLSLFHAYEASPSDRILYTESRAEFSEFTLTFLKNVA